MVQPSIVDLPPQLRLYPTCGVKKEQPKPLFWFPGLNPPPRRRLSPIPGSKRTGFESPRRYPNDRKVILARVAYLREVDRVRSNLLFASVPSPLLPPPHGASVMAGILKSTKAPRTSAHDRRVHFGEEEVVVVERWMQQRARKPMYHPCPPPACALFPPILKRVYQSWCFDPAAPTPDELDLQHRPQKHHRVVTCQPESISIGQAIGCGVACVGFMLLLTWLKP